MSASEQPEHVSNSAEAVPVSAGVDPQPEGLSEPVDVSDADSSDADSSDDSSDESSDSGDGSSGPSRMFWAGLVAGMFALYLAVTFVDVWLTSRLEYESPIELEGERAAVVLGAAQYNGQPSPVLKARLDEAAALYETGEVDLIVVTGGGQEADITTEAKSGYDYLRETSGIPDESLLLEVQGASTYESLAATARFLTPKGVTEVVLVTDRYHAKRSILTAEEVGLSPVVSLTPQDPSFERLIEESFGVALGRVITFRRLDRL